MSSSTGFVSVAGAATAAAATIIAPVVLTNLDVKLQSFLLNQNEIKAEVLIENLQEGQYIAYGAIITLESMQGGATCNASKTYYLSSADYNEKAIASQIIADGKIYSTEAGKGYNFAINVGGVNKYSKYTLTHLKELYKIAENTTELTAWVEQTA